MCFGDVWHGMVWRSTFVEGEVRDCAALRRWVWELSEKEAAEEADRICCGPEPELPESQVAERVRRGAAKWRLRSPRVHLRGLLDRAGNPLLDAHSVGEEVSAVSGGELDVERDCEDVDGEAWLLDSVQDLHGPVEWRVGRDVVRAATARTGHSSPRPGGLPYAAWRCGD